MNHLSGNVSFLFSSGYFHIFSDASADFSVLPRILFCIFSVRLQKIICCFFIRIIRFLRFFRFVGIIFLAFSRAKLRNFSSHSRIFYASPEFFQKKNPLFSAWISLADDPFFLFSGSIFRFFPFHPIKNSILPEYFSSHPAGIFTFPDFFCTVQTRAHLHARNNILSTPPGFLFLIPENLP